MKQTWKKLGSLVSVGILAVSLTACGSTKNEINEKVAQNLYDSSVNVVQTLTQSNPSELEQALEENPIWMIFLKMPLHHGLIPMKN